MKTWTGFAFILLLRIIKSTVFILIKGIQCSFREYWRAKLFCGILYCCNISYLSCVIARRSVLDNNLDSRECSAVALLNGTRMLFTIFTSIYKIFFIKKCVVATTTMFFQQVLWNNTALWTRLSLVICAHRFCCCCCERDWTKLINWFHIEW